MPFDTPCGSFSLSSILSVSGWLLPCPALWTWRISQWIFRPVPCSLKAVSLLFFCFISPFAFLFNISPYFHLSLFPWPVSSLRSKRCCIVPSICLIIRVLCKVCMGNSSLVFANSIPCFCSYEHVRLILVHCSINPAWSMSKAKAFHTTFYAVTLGKVDIHEHNYSFLQCVCVCVYAILWKCRGTTLLLCWILGHCLATPSQTCYLW